MAAMHFEQVQIFILVKKYIYIYFGVQQGHFKVTDHLTYLRKGHLLHNLQIYIGETGRILVDHFCEMKKKVTQMHPNQLQAILIFLITPSTTWPFAGYPDTTGTQKAAKNLNKNSSFNRAHSINTGSMNASHSTNLFTNYSCHHIFKKLLHTPA